MSVQLAFDGMIGVPYVRTETSISAAKRVKANPEHRESDKSRILAYIESCGERGCTDQEIQKALSMNPDSERPRRFEAYRASKIKTNGTRLLPNGNRATIWVIA